MSSNELEDYLDRDDVPADLKEAIARELQTADRVTDHQGLFRTLGTYLRAGLFAADECGRVSYVNERLANMTGRPCSALIGRHARELVNDASCAIVDEQLQTCARGDYDTRELSLACNDRGQLEVELSPFPLFDAIGRYRGCFVIVIASCPVPSCLDDTNLQKSRRDQYEERLDVLSARKREILEELFAGHRVGDMASRLAISRHTVRNHLKAIYRKLGVHSQVELLSTFWSAPQAQKVRPG